MKCRIPYVLLLLAASAFGHAPEHLLGTTLKNSQLASRNAHQYTYLTGGQRGTQTRTDGSSVTYNYDGIRQLKKALGTGGQSPENLGYSYDAAWNLHQRTNGDSISTFKVDGKNQMTTAPDGSCTYDANGNLVSAKNGLLTFAYDDENRLTLVLKYASPSTPNTRTEFTYDGLSRLRVRREYTWVPNNTERQPAVPVKAAALAREGGVPALREKAHNPASSLARGGGGGSATWQLSSETRYVYDGRRVIQERNGSNVPLVSYTRGNDLSGSLEGAGGIGGLLGRSHGYNLGSGAWSAHNYYHADGAGNVTYLVNSSQMLAANYRYDPYGNLLASSGTLATANVYRFSSKELHLNSGLYAYGYRFYSPNWQRWLNQDPIGEEGGINLYGFVGNNPINEFDPFGLAGTHPGVHLNPETIKFLLEEAMEQAAQELGIPVPQLLNTKNLWDKMIRKGVLNPKNWDLSDFHELLDNAKNAKKCSDDMLYDLLKAKDSRDLHKKKEKILNQFKKVLQGNDNPDVFPDAAGKVVIRSTDGKILIPTGKTFEELLPGLLK